MNIISELGLGYNFMLFNPIVTINEVITSLIVKSGFY